MANKNTSRKAEILQTTARLFRKKGYQGTSMRGIAEEVGIQAASIYNHFGSKHLLLETLLIDVAQRFTKGMSEIKNRECSASEQLEQLIALHVDLTAKHTNAIALIAAEWVHLKEPARGQYLQLRNQYEADFKAVLEEGKRNGTLQLVDTEIALFSILSTLRWLYSWYSRNKDYDIVKLKQQITTCLLHGLNKV